MGGYWLNAEIDRTTDTFNLRIGYGFDPPPYPEYVVTTNWGVSYSRTGGPLLGSWTGSDTWSGQAFADLGLEPGPGLKTYVIEFYAGDVNSLEGVSNTWNVFSAAYDTTPQSILGSTIDDIIIGGAGGDVLRGFDGADLVDAGAGNDIIDGGSGNDIIYGGSGNDQLNGLDGDDDLVGGTGDDLVTVDANDRVIELAGEGHDRVFALTSVTLADNVEELILLSIGDLSGTGNSANNLIFGNNGANTLSGSYGDDILIGNGGDDLLLGGAGADTLNGGAGIDTVTYTDSSIGIVANLTGFGSGGIAHGDAYVEVENIDGSQRADTLIGDGGGNTLSGLNGDDILDGGGGHDILWGGQGADTLNGGADFDTVTYTDSSVGIVANLATGLGSSGAAYGDTYIEVERIDGSQGADTLVGDAGRNTLLGVGGNDVLYGGAGADVLVGGTEIDTASYYTSSTGVSVNLTAQVGSGNEAQGDLLFEIENLSGSQGNDSLTGTAYANTLQGWNGNDVLTGAGGKDMLTGGAGADRFAYTTVAQSVVGANADRITDFNHVQGDKIDLSAIDADTGTAGDQTFSFIGSALYTGVAGQLRYHSNGTITTIAGDINGDSASDFHIQLTGSIGVVAGDFVI
ncbi:Ca2+-binding RTX toxin-like protein [Inquilinus ginsengisoli]|uniref:calcium-binding protein n=1 Tax=Inquilinus ginsengisoli TaxID=363840 RepID=UPI003D1C7605